MLQPGLAEAGAEHVEVLPELLPPLGLALHQFERLDGGGRDRGRQRLGQHIALRLEAKELDDVLRPAHVAAEGAEGLRERAAMEVDLVLDAEMLGGAAAVLAEDAGAVGIVDEEARLVPVLELDDLGQRRELARHAVDAVDGNQLGLVERAVP